MMVKENKSLINQYAELEQSLKKAKEETEYYKNIAVETGRIRLREIDQLSRLITERKKAEEALREGEELLRATVESTADGILVVDEKGQVTYTNKRFAQLWQIPDELIRMREDKRLLDFVLGQLKEPELFLSKVQALYKTSDEDFDVLDFKDGRVFERFSSPLIRDGQIAGRVWSFRDITDRKRAERALRESEGKFRFLAEKMADIVWTLDRNFQTTYVSPSIENVLGFRPEERKHQSLEEMITPESMKKVQMILLEELRCNEVYNAAPDRSVTIEVEYYRKDGSTVWMENNVKGILDNSGAIVGMYGVSRDITERKRYEEQIKASLKEKEILLREIHHRVKNNLMVTSSLLSMQANIVDDHIVHSALQESQNRVNAMALIHDTLCQSESLALVDLERYVNSLISNIVSTFDGISGHINFEVEVRNVNLEVNQAVPCGLIINELATNALKHAFDSGQNGVVRITARYTEESEVELTVSDNGIGLSEELDWKKSKSLGFRLISLLVDQLHGIMDIRNDPGTEIAIKWPVQLT
jgi:PAS domain S-box-containing protein